MSDASHPLFTPLNLGAVELPNRIVQAPCTRDRSDADRVPTLPRMAEHYALRAAGGFGLLITEATLVCAEGAGYIDTPGIYNEAQVAAWKEVTAAVAAAGLG